MQDGNGQHGSEGTPVGAAAAPEIGVVARDTENGRTGEAAGHVGGRVQLRPLGGGAEWEAHPENIRAVNGVEALSARVAEANRRSRGEVT